MKKKPSQTKQPKGVSRREFGRRAAITLAGGALAVTASPAATHALTGAGAFALPPQEEGAPQLSAQAQAEVEAKLQHVLAAYGSRLSDDQKKHMRRIITNHVRMLETIRPISLANGDTPATALELITDADTGSLRKES
jgi:hypothetical protein